MVTNHPIKQLDIGERWLSPSCQIVISRIAKTEWRVQVTIPGIKFNRLTRTNLDEVYKSLYQAKRCIATTTPFAKSDRGWSKRKAREERELNWHRRLWLSKLCKICKLAYPLKPVCIELSPLEPTLDLGICKTCYDEIAFGHFPLPRLNIKHGKNVKAWKIHR